MHSQLDMLNVNSIYCKHWYLSVSLPSARVIRVWDSKEDLVDSCLEETGGLGVDIIIDSGGLPSLYMTFVTISTKSSLMCF